MSRELRTIVLAAILAAVFAAPAAASVSFSPAQVISDPTGMRNHPQQDPRVAVAPDGAASVVWAESTYGSFNHAYVNFARLAPNGTVSQLHTFDVGTGAAYYVDPDVAVSSSGRALVVFNDNAGNVLGAFIAPDGTVGPELTLGTGAHAQATFAPDGRPIASWTSPDSHGRVVTFDPDGNPLEPSTLSTKVTITRLDTSAGNRIIWSGADGIFSASVDGSGLLGGTTRLAPAPLPRGYYDTFSVAAGRFVARLRDSRADSTKVITGPVNGKSATKTLAEGREPAGPNPRIGARYANLALTVRSDGTALVTWTIRVKGRGPKGVRLHGAFVKGSKVVSELDGSFAGTNVKNARPVFDGAGKAVIVTGYEDLSAFEISDRGDVTDHDKIARSHEKKNRNLVLAPIGRHLVRLLWEAGDRGNGGVIETSVGGLR